MPLMQNVVAQKLQQFSFRLLKNINVRHCTFYFDSSDSYFTSIHPQRHNSLAVGGRIGLSATGSICEDALNVCRYLTTFHTKGIYKVIYLMIFKTF